VRFERWAATRRPAGRNLAAAAQHLSRTTFDMDLPTRAVHVRLADIDPQPKPVGSVGNDPKRVSAHIAYCRREAACGPYQSIRLSRYDAVS
jgi:hypothetical protein